MYSTLHSGQHVADALNEFMVFSACGPLCFCMHNSHFLNLLQFYWGLRGCLIQLGTHHILYYMAVLSKWLQVIIWFLDWWGRERTVIIALGFCWCNSHLLAASASRLLTRDVLADMTGQRGSSHSFKSQYVSFWKTDHFPCRGRHFFSQDKGVAVLTRTSKQSVGSCNFLVRRQNSSLTHNFNTLCPQIFHQDCYQRVKLTDFHFYVFCPPSGKISMSS